MSYFGEDDPRLEDIRKRGQDAYTAGDWAGFRAMEDELRSDEVFWTGMWAPVSALAASRLGEPAARRFLDEAVAAGFDGPGGWDAELTEAFGADPDWPELLAAMRANVPPPPMEFLDWPAARPVHPVSWYRLPDDRAARLRERLPEPAETAWDTALRLLDWVCKAWPHANAHVDDQDALTILERVDRGERFACAEYSTVLSHALNALGVPARKVGVYTADYHAGFGKGHAVSEAWIDGLDTWVVLDGQNGMYWIDENGAPIGATELQEWYRGGGARARHVSFREEEVTDADADVWWKHFAYIRPTGVFWAEGAFVPVLQTDHVLGTDLLLRDRAGAYPDLSQVTIGVASSGGRPALTVHSGHPYATGFQLTTDGAQDTIPLDGSWTLPHEPLGVHKVRIATVTPYGTLTASTLTYRTA